MNDAIRRVIAQLDMNPSVDDLKRLIDNLGTAGPLPAGRVAGAASASIREEIDLLAAIVKWAARPKVHMLGFECIGETEWHTAYDLYHVKVNGVVPRPRADQPARPNLEAFKNSVRDSYIRGGTFNDRVQVAAYAYVDRRWNERAVSHRDVSEYKKSGSLPLDAMEGVLAYLGAREIANEQRA